MKIRGKIIIVSIIAIIFVIVLNMLTTKNNKLYNDEVIEAFENTLKSEGIEHLKITREGEGTSNIYRDTVNGKEQMDTYDKDGIFITRDFTTNFGKNIMSISNMSNYGGIGLEGINTLVTPEIEKENKEIMKTSIIEHDMTIVNTSIYDKDWKKERSKEKGILKYSSQGTYIYVDSNKKTIIKREIYRGKDKGKNLYEVMEIDKIDTNSEEIKNIFKIDSPLIFEDVNNNINFENINIIDSDLNKDDSVPKGEDAENSVG